MKKSYLMAAIAVFAFTGCQSTQEKVKENPKTVKSAGIGAAAGGALGAVIGKNSGDTTKGAAIGAALGAVAGGLVGRRMDKQAKELERIAETKRTDEGLVSKLKSDILFESGKADLKSKAQADLAEMAGIMKKYPENVLVIQGFTDSTGSEKINDELSQRRAEAVRKQLIINGIPASTVTALGMGPANPIGSNDTAEGRQQNRRVEIEITPDPSKAPKQ